MLVLLIRVFFVILSTLAGHSNGAIIFGRVFDGAMPWWFGTAMGFAVAITLIAAEQAFRRRFTRSLVGFLVGLAGGLTLSFLVLQVLRIVLQDDGLYSVLDVPVSLVTTYLVMITVVRNVDRWRVILPFVELHAEQGDASVVAIDVATLADGRLVALLRTGLVAQRVLIHRSAVTFWERESRSGDTARTVRAERALKALRELTSPSIEIDETEIPNTTEAADAVLRLCRLETARLVTAERESVRRAAAEGVGVVDLSSLAAVLNPPLRPGDQIEVLLDKPGEGKGQAVGRLDDGSLVVVSNGAGRLGQRVTVTILRLHQSATGRMIFSE
jgi:uncharacterized protein YacL